MIVIESVNHITVSVSDIERSVKFYKDLFDFDVVENISNSGQAFLRMGDIMISLVEEEGYVCQENCMNGISFYVDEEDFDDALSEVEDWGLEIVYGPENLRNGQRVVFTDPDGNHIELSYPKIG